ncbi:hypothetical protein [Zoogloea sp.]|uniref:hypothetical protein n=1 Tax=Zoogloea sp. TaxID=49181 RepID=UPI0035B4DF99
MGMTLWIHTLENGHYSQESEDHSLMHRYSEALDALCEELKIKYLSDFFDFTDLEYNYGDEDSVQECTNDVEPDPITGLGYGIADMQWFEPADGLKTINQLHHAVSAMALPELPPIQRSQLLSELEDCLQILQTAQANNGYFHLAVLE